MPFYRKPRNFVPLHSVAEKKTLKNGQHHAVFTTRFDKYVGDWKDNKKSGKGYLVTITGKLYEGDWLNGFRHGFGTMSRKLPSGHYDLEYRGDWIRGKPEGVGWRYHDNGDVYFGFWKKGHRHGYGKMWYNGGAIYVGYWDMNKRHGLGMFIQEDGNRYEGNWEGDTKQGLGRFYHLHSGQLQEGCWREDFCVNSKMTDIVIRQHCDLPTKNPIPPNELQDSKKLQEGSKLWMEQKLGEIDKKLQNCIDQMD